MKKLTIIVCQLYRVIVVKLFLSFNLVQGESIDMAKKRPAKKKAAKKKAAKKKVAKKKATKKKAAKKKATKKKAKKKQSENSDCRPEKAKSQGGCKSKEGKAPCASR